MIAASAIPRSSMASAFRGLNVDSAALGRLRGIGCLDRLHHVNDTPIFANFLLTDIAQVEVLRGPQGTLYGSGALGGTVRYIMNAPKSVSMAATANFRFLTSQRLGRCGLGRRPHRELPAR